MAVDAESDCATWNKGCDEWSGIYRRGYGGFCALWVDFDVYYGNHSEAQAHGHQTWEAYLADSNGSQSVEVTQTTTKRIFNVKLTNYGFDAVAQRNLTEVQKTHYAILNQTYGNRDYLFDRNNISNSGGGFHYEIPPEALTDEKFRNMITEAEKYLGYPMYGEEHHRRQVLTVPDLFLMSSTIVEMAGISEDRQQKDYVISVLMYLHRMQSLEI